METPANLNDQHAWGGQPFQSMLADSSPITNEQDQVTLVARGQQNAQVPSLSQAEVIPSSSENLFHPVSHDPSAYVFKLPNVPSNPVFMHTDHLIHSNDLLLIDLLSLHTIILLLEYLPIHLMHFTIKFLFLPLLLRCLSLLLLLLLAFIHVLFFLLNSSMTLHIIVILKCIILHPLLINFPKQLTTLHLL